MKLKAFLLNLAVAALGLGGWLVSLPEGLATPLGASFWQGVAMVIGGSLLCWLATRENGAAASD